jgi:hypothetical protein
MSSMAVRIKQVSDTESLAKQDRKAMLIVTWFTAQNGNVLKRPVWL